MRENKVNNKGDICPMCEKGILIEEIFNRSVFTYPRKIDGDAKEIGRASCRERV